MCEEIEFVFLTRWVLVTRIGAVEVHCNHYTDDLVYRLDLFLEQHAHSLFSRFVLFFIVVFLIAILFSVSTDFMPMRRVLSSLHLELLLDWTDSSLPVPTKFIMLHARPDSVKRPSVPSVLQFPRAARKHS